MENLAQAVEDLVVTGLTAASETTCKKIQVTFHEASRLKLLRLSATLRVIVEELNRFTSQSPLFSRKRFCFFINRAWLISHGIARALRENDEEELARLLWTPGTTPLRKIELVTLGVSKKLVPGTFCAFEFRLRTTKKTTHFPAGHALMWSCVFPLKEQDVPPEAFLHLTQRQGFTPNVFLEGKVVQLQNLAVTQGQGGVQRVILGEKSKVTSQQTFTEWDTFKTWNVEDVWQRLQNYTPGPLDLEVEMQEEVMLAHLKMTDESERNDQFLFHLAYENDIQLEAVVSKGPAGEVLRKKLKRIKKGASLPCIFGLMHYERCRLILQPLSFFTADGMEHLMISTDKVDRAALLRTLSF